MSDYIDSLDEEARAELRKIILDNKNLGGSSWHDYSDDELNALGLGYLTEAVL